MTNNGGPYVTNDPMRIILTLKLRTDYQNSCRIIWSIKRRIFSP